MINLVIFEYFYRIVSGFINCYNIDFFGLGFTWLQFLVSVCLIGVVLTFLFQGLNLIDKFNFSQIIGLGIISRNKNKKENHNVREQQMLKEWYSTGKNYPPPGYIDVWGDETYIIKDENYF